MISKKKKSDIGKYGIIVDCKEAKVLDNPEKSAPLVCQVKAGSKVKLISDPNKEFYGVGVSNSVVGFVEKKYLKVE